jgi:type IV pilus assembly protein PilN
MIKLNLIPYRDKEKKDTLKRQIIIIAGALVLFCAIVVSVHVYLSFNLNKLEGTVAKADARLVILNKLVGDVEKFKKDKKELEMKLGVINTLEVNRSFPVRLLDRLNMLVPSKELWLEKLSQTGKYLNIEGVAKDNGVVAHFMGSLEKEPFFSSVDLLVTREKEIAGVKLQQFSITCGLSGKGE